MICEDGEEACNTTTVSVGEILNPATILPHDTELCENSITLEGSLPDPGVTVTWLVDPVQGLTIVQNGTELTLTHNSNSVCKYEITYVQSLGNCLSTASTEIQFTKSYTSVSAGADGVVCGLEVQQCGTTPGCGGTPLWAVSSTPPGGTAIISDPNARCPTFSVNVYGTYCFEYTIENGNCPTATDEVCFEFINLPDIDLGPDEYFVTCSDTWDIASLHFSVDDISGATYEWFAQSSMGSGWISFSDPNAAATTVSFAGTPVDISEDGLWMYMCVSASLSGNCGDTKCFRINANPTVTVSSETVNLLCGGDAHFMPQDYIETGNAGGTLTGTFVDPPPGSGYSDGDNFFITSNTELNLTTSGTYTFDIEVSRSGTDPLTGNIVTCTDETTLTVIVADIPTINAGSDIVTCATVVELNGNTPLDADGTPVNIPVLWEQISGPPGASILSPTSSNTLVTGLEHDQTYVFQYSFSKDPDCYLVDEVSVTIRPKEECCELQVAIVDECMDGCIGLQVTGADSYLWTPATGIDDPTSPTPMICNSVGGLYTVYGITDGEVCGSALIELDPCEDTSIDCGGYYVEAYCTQCGCGDLHGVFKAYDSNGVLVDPEETSVTWILNDLAYGGSYNPLSVDYYGPIVYHAHIVHTDAEGGVVCDTIISGVVTCPGDCPNFQVATCGDPLLLDDLGQCDQYYSNLCTSPNNSGLLFLLDDVGNIAPYNVDWTGDGLPDGNPYQVYNLEGCGPFTVRAWTWGGGCDVTFDYELNCCTQITPYLQCREEYPPQGQLPQFWWEEVCGSEFYEVELHCLSGSSGYYELHTVYEGNGNGTFSFAPTTIYDEGCDLFIARVRAFCSASQSFGEFSNCLMLGPDICFDIGEDCGGFELDILGDGGQYRKKVEEILQANQPAKWQLYPNPVQEEEVYLELGSFKEGTMTLIVQDVDGKIVQEESWQNPQGKQTVYLESLPAGVYLFSLYDDQGQLLQSQRLVKTSDGQ